MQNEMTLQGRLYNLFWRNNHLHGIRDNPYECVGLQVESFIQGEVARMINNNTILEFIGNIADGLES